MNEQSTEIINEIVSLSKKSGIVTKYTVFHGYLENNIPEKYNDNSFKNNYQTINNPSNISSSDDDSPNYSSFGSCNGSKTIFVRSLNGQNLMFNCDGDTRIENLKGSISQKTGMRPDNMRLVYGSRQLENGLTCDDYGIQENSTILMVLRLTGGPEPLKIEDLLKYQNSDGSFHNYESISPKPKEINLPEEFSKETNEIQDIIKATLLSIYILEKEKNNSKYKLIIKKAYEFLNNLNIKFNWKNFLKTI